MIRFIKKYVSKLFVFVQGAAMLVIMYWAYEAARKACFFMFQNIFFPYPSEPRENAIVFTTQILLKGGNPFRLENQPVFMNPYGVFYSWVALPLAAIFGPDFAIHRFVSCVMIFIGSGFLFLGLRKAKVSVLLSISSSLIFIYYLGFSMHIVSRPDSLGLALFLASVFIPYYKDFGRGSLIVSIILSVCGFLTKPYFVLGAPCVALYLFLFKSKVQGFRMGCLFVVAVIAAVMGIQLFYETYLLNSFFVYFNVVTNVLAHLKEVGGEYLRLNRILLFMIGLTLIWDSFQYRACLGSLYKGPRINFKNSKSALILFSIELPTFMLCCGVFIIVWKLGRHTGNGIMYYHQLITPFLLWMVFRMAAVHLKNSLVGLVFILLYVFPMAYGRTAQSVNYSDDWKAMEAALKPYKSIFHSYALADVINRQGKPVYDTGLTEYAICSSSKWMIHSKAYQKNAEWHREDILSKVRNHQFDVIALQSNLQSDFIPKAVLEEHYAFSKKMPMRMTFFNWDADFYEPKKKGS